MSHQFFTVLFLSFCIGFSASAKEVTPSKTSSKPPARKTAQQTPCEVESYAAVFKRVVEDRASQFEPFFRYSLEGSGADLISRNGQRVVITVRISTWVGGHETGMGQPRQFDVLLQETRDNACQVISVTEASGN
jgi:hypothetical protein